ncbi:MAG: hypothetical protein CMJ83_04150 [Planctomycetes bacterium]|nr:hypothetical protein [Planctomycetota bacterium]
MRQLASPVAAAIVVASVAGAQESAIPEQDLALRVVLEKTALEQVARVKAAVVFANRGSQSIRFHAPWHVPLIRFPSWRFIAPNGEEFRPPHVPFGSKARSGMQGDIVTLEPGAAKRYDFDFSTFVPARAAKNDVRIHTPLALAPGTWKVSVDYTRRDDRVPHRSSPFARSGLRSVPGLWIGSAKSVPVTLTIAPSTRPLLRISGPRDIVPGLAYPLEISVQNPAKTALELEGAFRVRAWTKAEREVSAVLVPAGAGLRPGEAATISVPAGATRSWTVDLSGITLRGRDATRSGKLADLFRFSPSLICVLTGTDGTKVLASNALRRFIAKKR